MKTRNLFNLAKVTALSLGLFITSCTNESFDEIPENNESELLEKFFLGETIYVKSLGNKEYISGDVIYHQSQFDTGKFDPNPIPGDIEKLGVAPGIRRWSNNTIVYVIENGFSQRVLTEIQASMDEWTSKTTIKFKERTNESNYVIIRPNGQSCNCGSARLGSSRGGTVNLGSGSTRGVIIHEFGHTLGYIHEQNRSDRDQFVDIFPENIQDGAISQFRISNNSVNPGAFDVNSTMIYSSFTFSKNRQPVMLQKDGSRIPFRNGLSAGDIAGTSVIYPGDTTNPDPDPNPNDICDGVNEWVRGRRYQVGDRVTYRGSLFERDFTRWNNLGRCGTNPPADICEGIASFNGNNSSYSTGDKVTYRGSLYERQSNGRWSNLGRCGS